MNIINPWKRNRKNTLGFHAAVRDLISKSKDKDSLWNQISKLNQFTDEEIFSDLMILLGGGTETSAHNFVAILYYLAKFPAAKEKLIEELAKIGIERGCDLNKTFTMDNIQS